VVNTDLHPISYRFKVITDYCSNLVQKAEVFTYRNFVAELLRE